MARDRRVSYLTLDLQAMYFRGFQSTATHKNLTCMILCTMFILVVFVYLNVFASRLSLMNRGTVPSQLEHRPWQSTHIHLSSRFTVSTPWRSYPSCSFRMASSDCSCLGDCLGDDGVEAAVVDAVVPPTADMTCLAPDPPTTTAVAGLGSIKDLAHCNVNSSASAISTSRQVRRSIDYVLSARNLGTVMMDPPATARSRNTPARGAILHRAYDVQRRKL